MVASHRTVVSARTTVVSIFIAIIIIRIACTRITCISCITSILAISFSTMCIFTASSCTVLTRLARFTFCTLLFALLCWTLTTCIRSCMCRTSLTAFAILTSFACMTAFTSTTTFCIAVFSHRSTCVSTTARCFLLTLSRRSRLYCSHLCSMLIICCIHSSS